MGGGGNDIGAGAAVAQQRNEGDSIMGVIIVDGLHLREGRWEASGHRLAVVGAREGTARHAHLLDSKGGLAKEEATAISLEHTTAGASVQRWSLGIGAAIAQGLKLDLEE